MHDEAHGRDPREVPTRASLLSRLRGNGSADATAWEEGWFEFDLLYRPVLQRFARSRGVPESDVDDLCQRILLGVRRAMETFVYNPAQCRFQTWLFSVARNHVASHLRRPSRILQRDEDHDLILEQVADPHPGPDEQWQQEFDRSLLRVAWETVRKTANPGYVRLYRKHVIDGCTVPETVAYFRDASVTPEQVHIAKHRINQSITETIQRLRRNPLYL